MLGVDDGQREEWSAADEFNYGGIDDYSGEDDNGAENEQDESNGNGVDPLDSLGEGQFLTTGKRVLFLCSYRSFQKKCPSVENVSWAKKKFGWQENYLVKWWGNLAVRIL